MAKGNIFLGMGRGKLGDVVLTRNGGEQVTRPRNRHPRNPQTPAQMFQRGCMASVSEMYIRGTRNFFKYAFSNKSAIQSEFNKFCQLNIGRVPCNSKSALFEGAPTIGNFIMTVGVLPSIIIEKAETDFIIRMSSNVGEGGFEDWTMGDISKAFKKTFGLADGDIITFVDLSSPAVPYTSIEYMIANKALTSIAGTPRWNIKQFRIDTLSSDLASDIGMFKSTSSDNVLALDSTYKVNDLFTQGVVMVASRVEGGKTLVSSSEVVCNTATQNAINIGMSPQWKEAVARYWIPGSESEIEPINILQGSLSRLGSAVGPITFTLPDYIKFPVTIYDFDGTDIEFSAAVDLDKVAAHLKVYLGSELATARVDETRVRWYDADGSEFLRMSLSTDTKGTFGADYPGEWPNITSMIWV